MKYEVVHSFLQSVTPVKGGQDGEVKSHQFKQGEEVTAAQLEAAGHDVEFLLKNGAVEEMKGTRSKEDDVPEPPTTSQDATPGMGQAPEGPGKPTADDKKVGETGRKK